VSIVVGLVSAALYLHSQVDIAFQIPGTSFEKVTDRRKSDLDCAQINRPGARAAGKGRDCSVQMHFPVVM
jgi:hypothetical protein